MTVKEIKAAEALAKECWEAHNRNPEYPEARLAQYTMRLAEALRTVLREQAERRGRA